MLPSRQSGFLASLAYFILGLLISWGSVRADGLIVIPHPPAPVPGHFAFAPLEVTYHKVETSIDDQVAVTSVDQEFHNPHNARLEGDYIFPVPAGAQINKFAMDIDGKSVEAELLSADKAKTIYEDIVRKSRDPALLEYSGRAMFRVRIFPIEPLGNKRITLKYTQLLKSANNLLDYHYTLNTEKYSAKPLKNLALKITIKSSDPLTSLYSPTHDVEIKRHGANEATVGFEAKEVRPDTDFHLFIGRKAAAVGLSVLTYKPDADKEGYFVLLASPTTAGAAGAGGAKPMPKDVVFVMDTSGSMSGVKLTQAQKALSFCVNSLNPQDRFDIVRFSTEAESFYKGLMNANDDYRKKALEYIDNMKAGGGTAIKDALAAAFNETPALKTDVPRLFMLVFITDGQPTVGEQDPDRILASVKDNPFAKNVRIFCFGVGTDVNTKLLDQLAEQSRASTQYVLPNEDLELPISNFFAKVQDPVLTGLKLDLGGIHATKLYPRELPDLFKGDQLVVFGAYDKEAHNAAVLTGTMNGQPVTVAQDVLFASQTDNTREWIGKLWAVRRIGYLLDEIRLHGESKELKDEVTDLARRWGVVTPYTAMLIIEDEKTRGVATESRSLRDMDSDGRASGNAAANRDTLRGGATSGGSAVSGSMNLSGYKAAQSVDSVQKAAEQQDKRLQMAEQGGAGLGRSKASAAPAAPGGWVGAAANGLADSKSDHGYKVVTNYAQQNRVIARKTFYLNASQWTDQALQQAAANTPRQRIVFASDEYFELLKQQPESAQYLALGNNVTFMLQNKIYEVVEK